MRKANDNLSAKASWASKAERAGESRLAGGGMNVGEESLRNFAVFAIGKIGIARGFRAIPVFLTK
ncbi:MAG: hypothetical protein WC530_03840 [Candidatus Omnitrophota bacterium]